MKALITGISGQDGYFLSQFLLSKGYEVHGTLRRNSSMTQGAMDLLPEKIREQIVIHYGDITDGNFLSNLLKNEKPDEFYHLAAQSFVGYSFHNALSTYDVNIGGTLNICNAIKDSSPNTRMYFAATSEMFGQPVRTPQNEDTPLFPRNPYAISKLAGFWTAKVYREAYDMFISSGILFNHESEVRGPEFVTRKITMGVARVLKGDSTPIKLGNLYARKDWGFAGDFVKGMYQMLQIDKPDDFILATGETHTVKEFVVAAFKTVGIDLEWRGSGINEQGIDVKSKQIVITVDAEFLRPLESDNYMGDYSKAKRMLGWEPKLTFETLVKRMVKYEIEEKIPKNVTRDKIESKSEGGD